MTTTNFDTLNKAALREACKVRGVNGYGKLDNDGMRSALTKYEAEHAPAAPQSTPTKAAAPVAEPMVTTPPQVNEAAAAPATAKPAAAPKDMRNDVTRPKAGSICARIWEACDAMLAAGQAITFAALKEKLPDVNDATIRTQRQRHKMYHG